MALKNLGMGFCPSCELMSGVLSGWGFKSWVLFSGVLSGWGFVCLPNNKGYSNSVHMC